MAIVTPNSQFIMCKSPLARGYLHTLTFGSKTEQLNYFTSLPSRYLAKSDWSYIRKNGFVRANIVADQLYQYNYCLYQNKEYGDKWFYAFVTRIEYVNETCSYVYIETDIWQSWQFDIEWRNCYVEREHVSNDTVGNHTVPEPVSFSSDYYDFIQVSMSGTDELSGDVCYGIASSVTLATGAKDAVRNIVSGCPQACYLYGFKDYTSFNNAINKFYSDATVYGDDPIVYTFTYPAEYHNGLNPESDGKLGYTATPVMRTWTRTKSSITNTITATYKNNKCATFPFLSFEVMLPTQTIDYRVESFTGDTIRFTGTLGVSANTTVGFTSNYEDENLKFELSDYPQAPFKSSLTGQWEANMLNLKLGTLLNIGSTALGTNSIPSSVSYGEPQELSPSSVYQQPTFDTSGSGMIANKVTNVAGSIYNGASAKINMEMQQQRQTPTANGYTNTWTTLVTKRNRPIFGYSYLKPEIMQTLDEFFTMYGYQVNRVKTPAHNNRPGFNYIKCSNAEMGGNMPQEDLDVINSTLNRGITLWHTTSGFMNYGINNK